MMLRACLSAVLDARYLALSAVAAVVSLGAVGLVSAIIPNPVFGRAILPEPFAIVVWLVSGLLMGLLAGTYLAPPPAVRVALSAPGGTAVAEGPSAAAERRTSTFGYIGGIAAFLAIGCPVCNKIILVLLGTSGALTFWAPLQPIVGLASVVLLAGALAWRLRMRARGNACPVT
ncbi:MAG TPA: hypothetical protein VLM76_05995 [Patescibacteria group bacterium]|nr:hypothetical protein [Patescibacteria group bacterium]